MTLAVSGWKIRRPSEPWSVSIGLTTRGMPGSEFSAFLLPSDLSRGNRICACSKESPLQEAYFRESTRYPLLSCSYCLAWNVRFPVRLQGECRQSYTLGPSPLRHSPRAWGNSEGTPPGGERSPEPPLPVRPCYGEKRLPLLGRFPLAGFHRSACAHAPDLIRCMF